MIFELKERNSLVFMVDGQMFTRLEIKEMIQILTDLSQINSYELPYRGEELVEKARSLLKKP